MSDKETPPSGNITDKAADNDWNRDLINRLAFAALNEQRRARRWSVFFKGLLALYLLALLLLSLPEDWSSLISKTGGRHTAMVDLTGVIATKTEGSADTVIKGLRKSLPERHHHLIPKNEEAIQRGMKIVREARLTA